MFKKSVTIFVLTAFVFFTYSCSSRPKMVLIDKIKPGKLEHIDVLGFVNMAGKWVEFEEYSPGRIVKNRIIGSIYDKDGSITGFSIPLSEVRQVQMKNKHHTTEATIIGTYKTAIIALGIILAYAVIKFLVDPPDD